jgi:uncharacterized membrane protein
MRKTLEVVGLAMLAVLYWITYTALNGSAKLPDRVPTHFDVSGQPNGWGSTSFLWLLPIVATGIYLLMTVLGNIRFRRYNLPVRVTEVNLPFIQERTAVMVCWIKVELLCLFTYLQSSIIEGARTASFRLSPLFLPVFLAVVFLTAGWHLVTMIRGARERAESGEQFRNVGDFR